MKKLLNTLTSMALRNALARVKVSQRSSFSGTRLVCAQFWVLVVVLCAQSFFTNLSESQNSLILFWLHSALTRQKLGLPILPKSGRPRKLPPDIMVGIKDEAGHLARYGKALDAQDITKSIIQRKKTKAVNPFAEVSPPSYYQLLQVLDFISPDGAVGAELQTAKRQNECTDLRNGIACAVVATACLEGISPALIFNSDDICFELGLDRDLRVYVPTEVKLELSQLNRGVKVTGYQKIPCGSCVQHHCRRWPASPLRLQNQRWQIFKNANFWDFRVAYHLASTRITMTHKDFIAILYQSNIFDTIGSEKRKFLLDSQNLGLREHVYDNDPANLAIEHIALLCLLVALCAQPLLLSTNWSLETLSWAASQKENKRVTLLQHRNVHENIEF
jgi:hypothetical protein